MGSERLLSETRKGVRVECRRCGYTKHPIGRSAPLGMTGCDCPDYENPPYPGSLWPGESEADFGYPVSPRGTTDEGAPDVR